MLRSINVLAGVLLFGVSLASAAPVVGVLSATGHDRDWMDLPKAFDAQSPDQLTWDGTQPVSTVTDVSDSISAMDNRYGYIDFGSNWANLRITQTWTQYKNWSSGDLRIYQDLGWAPTYDGWNIPTLINETQLKLSSAAALPYSNSAQWARDVDLTDTPVTPQGQYLFVHTMDSGGNARASEFLFIGFDASSVPEPTTFALLGTGGLLLLKRRRA